MNSSNAAITLTILYIPFAGKDISPSNEQIALIQMCPYCNSNLSETPNESRRLNDATTYQSISREKPHIKDEKASSVFLNGLKGKGDSTTDAYQNITYHRDQGIYPSLLPVHNGKNSKIRQ